MTLLCSPLAGKFLYVKMCPAGEGQRRQKHLRVAVDGANQMMCLSRETDFSGKFKLFMFCYSHMPEYFFRCPQDFDGSLKYTQVETLFDQEGTLSYWISSASSNTSRSSFYLILEICVFLQGIKYKKLPVGTLEELLECSQLE